MIKISCFLCLSIFLSACSSVITLDEPCPYGGTRGNYFYIAKCDPMKHAMPVCDVGKPLAVIDFLPSLLVDTVLLPLQGVRYIASEDKSEICQYPY